MRAVSLLGLLLLAPPVAYSAEGRRMDEAKEALSRALAAYERNDIGAAKVSLAIALEAEPNFAEAQVLRAVLLAHDGKDAEAEDAFKKALELNPRLPKEASKRLEKEAHAIESRLTQQDFSHFRLLFHGADQRDKAWQAVKYLDSAYNHLGSRFGIFPPEKIPVIIFSSQEFWEAWKAPMWLGGFFDRRDGKVRVLVDNPPGGEDEMNRRLRHEFTHAFIYQLYPKDLPYWFQEGVAEFYAYANPQDSFWKENRLSALHKEIRGAPWLNLAKLQTVLEKKEAHPATIYLAYLQSSALMIYIAKERGESWIPRLMQELRAGQPFDAAFLKTVGLSADRFLEQLRSAWN